MSLGTTYRESRSTHSVTTTIEVYPSRALIIRTRYDRKSKVIVTRVARAVERDNTLREVIELRADDLSPVRGVTHRRGRYSQRAVREVHNDFIIKYINDTEQALALVEWAGRAQ